MRATDVLAIGAAYVDINCPAFPFNEDGFVINTETVGNNYETTLGGSGLNFCKLLTRLGLSTTFVSKIGADTTGQVLTDLMREANISAALVKDRRASTNVGINLINNHDQSIGFVCGTAGKRLEPKEVINLAGDMLTKAKYLYVSSCFKLKKLLPAYAELVEKAKKKGVIIILDHGHLVNGVTKDDISRVRWLARYADYYLPSRDEFMQLWDVDTIVEGLIQMEESCPGQTIVKDGAGGAVTLVEGRALRVPAFEVAPINTVGAGDSFNAGFIAAHHRGMAIEDSMRFGCGAAALKISQAELPTLSELELLLSDT